MTKKEIIPNTEHKYELFVSRDEIWKSGGISNLMKKECYNLKGDWIGSFDTANYLCNTKGIAPEKRHSFHVVCTIGYSKSQNKWYGWSHRAICGFTIGDKLYTEGLKKADMKTIKNMDEAKQAAINFADSVN